MKKGKAKTTKTKRTDWLAIFASLYFLLQMLSVHVFLFGWDFEPASLALKVFNAFDIQYIVFVALHFYLPFVGGIAFGSVWFVFLCSIPWVIWLVIASWRILFYFFALYQLLAFLIIKARQTRANRLISLDNVCIVKIGSPGMGKSMTGLDEAIKMSRLMWVVSRFIR